MRRAQAPSGPNHSPPRQILGGERQDSAHPAGATRIPRQLGHLAIGDYLAHLERTQNRKDRLFEFAGTLAHAVPKSRSPMSPRPGSM